jgi:hypothetical protein
LVGAVVHPWEPLDVYVYYGQEQVNASAWKVGATNGGYGNPAFANTGCLLENQATGPAGLNDPIPGTACSGATNVNRVQEITAGFWYNVYKGDLGRVRSASNTNIGSSPLSARVRRRRRSWYLPRRLAKGQSTTPNAGLNPNNQAVFFSLRYYPFN